MAGNGKKKQKRLPRWYFGGISSAGAAVCTHPLDLLKVHLQTQQEAKLSLVKICMNIVRTQGILALYTGISASMLRQLTYSTTRFGIYEVIKQKYHPQSFVAKVALAAGAGACGGFVGTPGDMINVRMQNDIKLPIEKRRNYKHAIDGLIRICKEEGPTKLFSGGTTATTRAIFMTIGQISFYDQTKLILLKSGHFSDTLITHLISSSTAGIVATLLTQPIDVVKTRMMNAKPGEFKSLFHCIRSNYCGLFLLDWTWNLVECLMPMLSWNYLGKGVGSWYTAKLGPLAFYKGFVPSAVRIAPLTIIVFMLYENLTKYFGHIVEDKDS